MRYSIRFVTPDEFQTIMHVVDNGTPSVFAPWFGLALRTMWATGCRPAEMVGTHGRLGRNPEEGGPRVSRIKRHHGLRARDILPNNRIFIEGKRTTPKGRTHQLKPRVVICADTETWNDLRRLASLQGGKEGQYALRYYMDHLKRRVPPELHGFSARWLRHSHAIAAIRSGVDLISIQRQLGHENLHTTAIYLRFAGLDEDAYLRAFGGRNAAKAIDCPSCGFAWTMDTTTGRPTLDGRMGVALRRRS